MQYRLINKATPIIGGVLDKSGFSEGPAPFEDDEWDLEEQPISCQLAVSSAQSGLFFVYIFGVHRRILLSIWAGGDGVDGGCFLSIRMAENRPAYIFRISNRQKIGQPIYFAFQIGKK